MSHGKRCAGFSASFASTGADILQKGRGIGSGGRFGESHAWLRSPLVVRSASENFNPWLGMRWRDTSAGVEVFDLTRGECAQDSARCLAQQAAITGIDRLEMPKEQDELLQMQLGELAVDAVKRVGDRVRDVF